MFVNRDMALDPIIYVCDHTEPGSLLRGYFVEQFCSVPARQAIPEDSLKRYPKDFLVDLIIKRTEITTTRHWNLVEMVLQLEAGQVDVDATQAASLTINSNSGTEYVGIETR